MDTSSRLGCKPLRRFNRLTAWLFGLAGGNSRESDKFDSIAESVSWLASHTPPVKNISKKFVGFGADA
jgi:hypothetical protein